MGDTVAHESCHMKTLLRSLLTAGLLCAVAVAAFIVHVRHAGGFSARAEPTHLEAGLAQTMLKLATPSGAHNRRNPIATTPVSVKQGMEHYADHCAQCHANNGSGQTMLGSGMYPKPPDMRLPATQHKTDGELFNAIENGIRLSGMPAFGSADGSTADESWRLVLFLRHLPALSAEEEQAMEHENPKSPSDLEEEQKEAAFLSGGAGAAK